MNLIEYLKEEKAKVSTYPMEKKLLYLADYYALWIIGILFVLIFLVYLIYHMFFAIKENWLYATFVNVMPEARVVTEIREDFSDYGGYNLKEKNIVLNTSSYFDASMQGGTNNTYFEVFVAAVEAGDLDIAIMEEDNLKAVGASGRLLDLSKNEMFAAYEDLFVYCTPYDEEYKAEVPVGIDISSSILVSKYHLYPEECVLGIGAYAEHTDTVIAFLTTLAYLDKENI